MDRSNCAHARCGAVVRGAAARRAAIAGTFLGLALAGCSSSPWSDSAELPFEAGAFDRVEPALVQVQRIPWERMSEAQSRWAAAIAESSTHASAWSVAERAQLGAELTPLLQLGSGAGLMPVATASFSSSSRKVEESELAKAAAAVGADVAVWARVDDGMRDVIVREPITEYTSGSVRIDDEWRTYNETRTAWVPVREPLRHWRYSAIYLRRSPKAGVEVSAGSGPE